MKRLLAVVVLVLALLVPVRAGVVDSVEALKDKAGRTICTTFSINEAERLWLTAGHCVADPLTRDGAYAIDGHPAVPVYAWYDDSHDWAVLYSTASARALKLAKHAPKADDEVEMRGFPYGLPELIISRGRIGGRNVVIKDSPVSDVLTIVVAGGNSGSPVLNNKGEVVGLLWGKFNRSEHGLTIPQETLRQFLAGFWEK